MYIHIHIKYNIKVIIIIIIFNGRNYLEAYLSMILLKILWK